jgi:hypothetical protein
VYVEMFEVATWGEHLRQHNERITGLDAGLYQDAVQLALEPPRVRHLLVTD